MLLELEDVHTYYGDSHVVRGVNLAGPEQGVVALLGRNGVGKTTTLRSVMGLTPSRRGQIRFKGRDVSALPAYARCRAGMGWVPEDRQIFSRLTVMENLNIAARPPAIGEGWTEDRILQYFPVLAQRRRQLGRTLSGGEQQMLTIARALMGNPQLLLLDEPSEGLAPQVILAIQEIVLGMREHGLAVLLVEQNTRFALSVCDTYCVLDHGTVVHVDQNDDPDRSYEVVERYLRL
jgi:branched-chain amino acid transport system ATP-binding protein